MKQKYYIVVNQRQDKLFLADKEVKLGFNKLDDCCALIYDNVVLALDNGVSDKTNIRFCEVTTDTSFCSKSHHFFVTEFQLEKVLDDTDILALFNNEPYKVKFADGKFGIVDKTITDNVGNNTLYRMFNGNEYTYIKGEDGMYRLVHQKDGIEYDLYKSLMFLDDNILLLEQQDGMFAIFDLHNGDMLQDIEVCNRCANEPNTYILKFKKDYHRHLIRVKDSLKFLFRKAYNIKPCTKKGVFKVLLDNLDFIYVDTLNEKSVYSIEVKYVVGGTLDCRFILKANDKMWYADAFSYL